MHKCLFKRHTCLPFVATFCYKLPRHILSKYGYRGTLTSCDPLHRGYSREVLLYRGAILQRGALYSREVAV